MKPYIIAEIGSNWTCLLDCMKQIEAAKACGADAVKFQLFTYRELYGISGDMKGELPAEWVPVLAGHSEEHDIDFMCSAFSIDGFKFVDDYVVYQKIASPEACSQKIRDAVFEMGSSIIISNGCLSYEEQVQIVDSPEWGADDVMLECTSDYPAESSAYQLSRILELAEDYDVRWGLSDHTTSSDLALLARGLGAEVFEKHVDLIDVHKKQETADTCVSAGFEEFKHYVTLLKSYKYIDYDKRKAKAKRLFGRTSSGYRPLPDADI